MFLRPSSKHATKALCSIREKSTALRAVPKLLHVENELLKPEILHLTPTHELLTKLGFVTHPKPGLVNWLTPGILMLNRLKELVRGEMNNAHGQEVSLSNLSHSSLWEKTGRWSGKELFKLKDSASNDYCLAPTCEEEITQLVKTHARSYKDFPVLYYQINNKYRDEKRPRSGLLRGREFVMKDAYSFDITEKEASDSYDSVVEAYRSVFSRLRVPFVQAEADNGDIGGSESHEWHYVHPSGEDKLLFCPLCEHKLNIEKTLSYPWEEQEHDEVSVRYYTTADEKTLVLAYYPASRTLCPQFIREEIPDVDLSESRTQEQVLDLFRDEDTLIGKRMVRIMDSRLNSRSNFPDFPIKFINRSLMTTLTDVPIVEAEEGEMCHKCEEGKLEVSRAIEVGHTFNLGTKYTEALECSVDVPQENGGLERRNLFMGCYGLGLSRIIAAIAEITRDGSGLKWPAAIAPWHVTVVATGDSEAQIGIQEELEKQSIDFRLDDRKKIGLGRKVIDSNMLGIPLVVIVGKNWPIVEIEERGDRHRGEDSTTEALFREKNYEWEITEKGTTIKHKVDVLKVGQVIKALIADM